VYHLLVLHWESNSDLLRLRVVRRRVRLLGVGLLELVWRRSTAKHG
jgi:hypothetical protein